MLSVPAAIHRELKFLVSFHDAMTLNPITGRICRGMPCWAFINLINLTGPNKGG